MDPHHHLTHNTTSHTHEIARSSLYLEHDISTESSWSVSTEQLKCQLKCNSQQILNSHLKYWDESSQNVNWLESTESRWSASWYASTENCLNFSWSKSWKQLKRWRSQRQRDENILNVIALKGVLCQLKCNQWKLLNCHMVCKCQNSWSASTESGVLKAAKMLFEVEKTANWSWSVSLNQGGQLPAFHGHCAQPLTSCSHKTTINACWVVSSIISHSRWTDNWYVLIWPINRGSITPLQQSKLTKLR